MTATLVYVLHQAAFGAIAAAGFGVLFNFRPVSLAWCAASGAAALAVRTLGLQVGWSLEAASFTAASTVTVAAVALLRQDRGPSASAVAVAGCIPMVPGAFFAQALLGLFALTAPQGAPEGPTVVATLASMLRVVFTLAGIGAGIAIPLHILRRREF
ncbi:ThrE_2 domain-containing protein [Rhodovastum atsumiense]|uniref:Threonine/Serine exporter ThrE domain-containing protein n=1 Tax=Rhodovastum atsumiense TaxID=504468 RepID=A0A5M6IT45_9PROT|nr:threonine/serine exporter family protein [Rhodovastum atsumiense]KAA5611493.1 hypothetical protein F1189_14290 [Rhodovastum atsumiense]CAH2601189.1 ThrE_2 domain-containing protein [Rhodovastum atsumiense]